MRVRTRRALTTAVGAVGALALLTGTAAAHYCYDSTVPTGSKAATGKAWSTAEETAAAFRTFLPPGECTDAIVARVLELGEEGALFMGPGLLAAGAVRRGESPSGMGHLFADARAYPACAPLFEDEHR